MKKSEVIQLIASGDARVTAEFLGIQFRTFEQWGEELNQDQQDKVRGCCMRHGVRPPRAWRGIPSPYIWRDLDGRFYFFRRGKMRERNGKIPYKMRRPHLDGNRFRLSKQKKKSRPKTVAAPEGACFNRDELKRKYVKRVKDHKGYIKKADREAMEREKALAKGKNEA